MAEQAQRGQGRQHLRVVTSGFAPLCSNWVEFERFIDEHPGQQWELVEGVVREKPWMASERNDPMFYLAHDIASQLDRKIFRVRSNSAHLQRSTSSFFIPDIIVFPTASFRESLGQVQRLEKYEEPMLLVIEIWSRSSGNYDIDTKIPEYQARGDLETWRLDPYERTLTVWRRREDGSYQDSTYSGGTVRVESLPNVSIDLDALFDFS